MEVDMIDGKYDVIFRGQIVKSLELAAVQDNLVKLFKSSPEAVSRLFNGNEVVIRKSLDYAAAMKYQSALKSAGALALIKEVENEKEQVVSETNPTSKSENTQVSSLSENSDDSSVDDKVTLSVAEVGAQILPPKIYERKEVDTSGLSLGEVGDRLLPEKERKIYPQPSIDHLSLDDK